MGTDADPVAIARKGIEKAKSEGYTTVSQGECSYVCPGCVYTLY